MRMFWYIACYCIMSLVHFLSRISGFDPVLCAFKTDPSVPMSDIRAEDIANHQMDGYALAWDIIRECADAAVHNEGDYSLENCIQSLEDYTDITDPKKYITPASVKRNA